MGGSYPFDSSGTNSKTHIVNLLISEFLCRDEEKDSGLGGLVQVRCSRGLPKPFSTPQANGHPGEHAHTTTNEGLLHSFHLMGCFN